MRPILKDESRAWNGGDAAAYSQAVATDCVFTNIFGQVFVGRRAFAEQHARIFATVYRGSRLEQSIEHLRIVQPDVALVERPSR
ncbi:SgcJ/EcaC family oxidoreductase [Sphingomonas sp. Root241]|uniref:SgcJ/EcaC family oxidoreductase n=1 Tax=Sphingomonas sp. Root241 TaxID=1736501 RepID=UPI0039E1A90E